MSSHPGLEAPKAMANDHVLRVSGRAEAQFLSDTLELKLVDAVSGTTHFASSRKGFTAR